MLEVVLAVPFWLELAATLTGGIAGSMSAVKARFDIFGTVCIACACGLTGGIVRDVLLQNHGIYAFQRPELIIMCIGAGIVVFFFSKLVSYLDPIIGLIDGLSVALWTVLSVGKALSAGLGLLPSIILGTVAAIGGGVMRDVFMSRQPAAFQAGPLFGSASLAGAICFAFMKQYLVLEAFAPFICVGVVLALRYASLFFGLETKPPHDYSDAVTKAVKWPVKKVKQKVRAPKGKTERDKAKATEAAKLRRHGKAQVYHDPSDRILVKDLADIRLQGENDKDDSDKSDPFDPFEPR
jgi:uncharacterized membrane protein YeiH